MTDTQIVENLADIMTDPTTYRGDGDTTEYGMFCRALNAILGNTTDEDGESTAPRFSSEGQQREYDAYLAEIRKRITDRETAQGRLF